MPENTPKNPIRELLVRFAQTPEKSERNLLQLQRAIAKEFGTNFITKDALVKEYRTMVTSEVIEKSYTIEKVLKLKGTRSLSGIVVVSILTKPYDCPGRCLYCPTQDNAPKSYIVEEPAVARAIMCNYDPYVQTQTRLQALDAIGHPIDKVNIRIIGGTWSFYPAAYQEWYIAEVFRACNDFDKLKVKSRKLKVPGELESLQEANETTRCRIVEISIETRQDYINEEEIRRLRRFGVTKVELGVQSIYDDVLRFNQRGHLNDATVKASKLLKDAGFKVSYQLMPNLPPATYDRDLAMFQEIFTNPAYQPDYVKIYPLALVKEAKLFDLYQQGNFKPYNLEELTKLLIAIKKEIPRYCRIERVIRDIPSQYIVEGGAQVSGLRQMVQDQMKQDGLYCQCIRCRESREEVGTDQPVELFREEYDSSDGREIFLTIETPDRKTLFSLLRLRVPSYYFSQSNHFLEALRHSAIIREIHTYGKQIPVGESDASAAQHKGYGKLLIQTAEKITKEEFNLPKISVISGVGVREYFKKQGYQLVGTYMQKKLS